MFQLIMLMLVPTPSAAVDLPQGIILRDLPQGPMPVSDKTLYPTNYRCPAEEKRSAKDRFYDGLAQQQPVQESRCQGNPIDSDGPR
jgi:hypothetical protein